MPNITFGVLTISDGCSRGERVDESGPNLVRIIENGLAPIGLVTETGIVPDNVIEIRSKLLEWCKNGVDVILTTGGTGLAETDVTPEATKPLLDKIVPGVTDLIFKVSSEITPLAALSRGVCGVCDKSLIINFPGSKKAAEECLNAVKNVIGHTVDIIKANTKSVASVHDKLQSCIKSKVDTVNVADRHRKSPYKMYNVSEAQKIMEKVLDETATDLIRMKTVSLNSSHGYVLAKDVISSNPVPPGPVSIKDGYAVRWNDPSPVKIVMGSAHAGDFNAPQMRIMPGYCARITTGAIVPDGCTAVIQVEDTVLVSRTEDNAEELKVQFNASASFGENIRSIGSDIKAGEKVLTKNTYLRAYELGVLATAGVTSLLVYEKPRIGILSTGNELQDIEGRLEFGKIRDSNRITLINALKENGFAAFDLGMVRDIPDELYAKLLNGFKEVDAIVTTGSVSMGERDYLKRVLETDLNASIHFGRVAMKPGKPTSFASFKLDGKTKLWFGLPGNPVSAAVTSVLFVIPALRKISGFAKLYPPRINARITEDIELDERPEYQRAVLSFDEETLPVAFTTGNQISSRLTSCVGINCFLELPPRSESLKVLKKGSIVIALLIRIP